MNPLRLIAQWYISRSLDLDLPMPRWVASRMERDPQLRSFYHSSLQLMHQLQGRATENPLEHPTVVLHRGRATRPSWTWAAFGSLAATLAILVLWLPLQNNFWPTHAQSSSPAQKVVHNPSPEDALLLVHFSQACMEQSLRPIHSLTQHSKETSWSSVNPKSWKQQSTKLGASVGKILSRVEQQARTSPRVWMATGRDGVDYFAEEIPKSLTTWIGL
ncbi:MAG: hypothetical protein U0905_16295 [Pirellulales bacterium]